MKPKVSVSVLTYNHGAWLGECLESIVTQKTTFAFEVIVGDDASTDSVSREILKTYASRYPDVIKPIFREQNIGVTKNYFDVTAHGVGDYIAHIDGDDRMLAGKLQKQADFLDAHPECSIVAHDLRVFDGQTNLTLRPTYHSAPVPAITTINDLVLNGCYFGHASKMYRRSAILSTHKKGFAVDFYLHIEHASRGNIGYLHEVLGEYRKSANSHTDPQSPFFNEVIQGHLDAYQRALELGCNPLVVYRGRTAFKHTHAMEMLYQGHYDAFKDLITIDNDERPFTTWRHRAVARMARFPRILRLLKTFLGRARTP